MGRNAPRVHDIHSHPAPINIAPPFYSPGCRCSGSRSARVLRRRLRQCLGAGSFQGNEVFTISLARLTCAQSVQLDPACSISSTETFDKTTEESYIALTVRQGASLIELDERTVSPGMSTAALTSHLRGGKLIDGLHFVPYYFRSNRGGRGQSRVGLRRWVR
jgi:hypothetical protein